MISLLTAALLMAAPGDPETELPTSLSAPAAGGSSKTALGLHLGYLQIPDAEDATVFYGIHLRIPLMQWLSLEGSVDISESDFLDDDAQLTLVPVQVTAIIKPFNDLPIIPYGVVGIGWYFTEVDYSGSLSGLDQDSSDVFGVHLGVGAELPLGDTFMLHADFRWIFMGEPDFDDPAFDDEDTDYWQLMIGASFLF
jgi:opacity protein-like surface antigen